MNFSNRLRACFAISASFSLTSIGNGPPVSSANSSTMAGNMANPSM